jgi:hypothetical protein
MGALAGVRAWTLALMLQGTSPAFSRALTMASTVDANGPVNRWRGMPRRLMVTVMRFICHRLAALHLPHES